MAGFTKGTNAECLLLDPAGQIGIEVDPGEDQNGQEGVFWTPELDAIVRGGYSRGWSGAREAINKIQSLHPKWFSHLIWDRAIQLGFQKISHRSNRPRRSQVGFTARKVRSWRDSRDFVKAPEFGITTPNLIWPEICG